MNRLIGQVLITILFSLTYYSSMAQARYVVVERYGGKRLRLTEGDDIHFKLKDQTALYNDAIMSFRDSTIFISSGIKINIKDITEIYRPRKSVLAIRKGLESIGVGFIVIPSLVYLTSENKYSPKESIIIGASLIAFAQLIRFVPKYKKYKMGKNSRIWVFE